MFAITSQEVKSVTHITQMQSRRKRYEVPTTENRERRAEASYRK